MELPTAAGATDCFEVSAGGFCSGHSMSGWVGKTFDWWPWSIYVKYLQHIGAMLHAYHMPHATFPQVTYHPHCYPPSPSPSPKPWLLGYHTLSCRSLLWIQVLLGQDRTSVVGMNQTNNFTSLQAWSSMSIQLLLYTSDLRLVMIWASLSHVAAFTLETQSRYTMTHQADLAW